MKTRILPTAKIISVAIVVALLMLTVAQARKTPAPQTSAERRGLRFSHGQHTEAGAECAKCHNAKASQDGWDDLLPGHKQCSECHDVQAADQCKTCHLSDKPEAGPRITRFSPRFGHVRHLEKGGLACDACHTKLDEPLDGARAGHLPHMPECMECHNQKLVKNDCAVCHLPADQLRPRDHTLNWIYKHGVTAAGERDEACNICHGTQQTRVMQCETCHQGDAISSPHPRDYVTRHGADAHLSDVQCSSCHEQRDFCVSCHRANNLVPPNHFPASRWANRQDGGDHTSQASFDLEGCMACHDVSGQDPVCAQCHGK